MEERDNIKYLVVGNRLSKSVLVDYLVNPTYRSASETALFPGMLINQ